MIIYRRIFKNVVTRFLGVAIVLGTVYPTWAAGPVVPTVEVLRHQWYPDTVWEKVGKTKFVWKATVRNNSDIRQRVYVYYDLLDAGNIPLARNVANKYIEPHQIVDVISDSYIVSADLPNVKSGRATVKIWAGKSH
jgi:hypothetical protein